MRQASKGSLNFGSAGAGSAGHLFLERVRISGKMNAIHVPFRGTPEGVTEILAGRHRFLCRAGAQRRAAGQRRQDLRARRRLGQARELDAGRADDERRPASNAGYEFWVAALAPVKTPRPIVERLNREIVAALKLKEMADRIAKLGGEPMPMTTAEFDAFLRKEIALNVAIVKAAGFKPQ